MTLPDSEMKDQLLKAIEFAKKCRSQLSDEEQAAIAVKEFIGMLDKLTEGCLSHATAKHKDEAEALTDSLSQVVNNWMEKYWKPEDHIQCHQIFVSALAHMFMQSFFVEQLPEKLVYLCTDLPKAHELALQADAKMDAWVRELNPGLKPEQYH